MEVFISWSQPRAEALAIALRDWIPLVIQQVRPWTSRDIAKGSRWEDVISEKLDACNFGIICLTPENLASDWVLFEAGALSKKVRDSRVCTYLLDLAESDVGGPLAKFQHSRANKEDTASLLQSLNGMLGEQGIDGDRFRTTFELWWPRLESRILAIRSMPPQIPATGRTTDEKIDELLLEVRSLQHTADRFVRQQEAGMLRQQLTGTSLEYMIPSMQTALFQDSEAAPVEASVSTLPLANPKRYRCRVHRLHPVFDVFDDKTMIRACCSRFLNELLALFGEPQAS